LFDERVFFEDEIVSEDPGDIFQIGPFTGDPAALHDVKLAEWGSNFLTSYDSGQPFFLSLGFHRPHGPWDETPREYHDLYDPSQLPLPDHLEGDLADVPASALFRTVYHENVLANDAWQPILASYFAAISFVDDMIGRVLDALENSSFADDTMIVFYSDHGYHLGDKDTWHKFTLWDSAARAPLIIVDPSASTPGSVVDTTVGLVDVFPTVLDLLNLPPKAGVDGTSLKPLIEHPDAPWEGAALTFMYGSWSLRTDEWRYTRYHDGAEELYDIAADPHEHINLALDPAHQAIKSALLADTLSYLAGKHWFQTSNPSVTMMGGTPADDSFVPAAANATLMGGDGDDVYFVWAPGQRVVESQNGGIDTVVTYGDFTQPLNVERVIAVDKGNRSFNLKGNAQDNWIHGGPSDDVILGDKGNDFLDAAGGVDRVDGGVGNDTLLGGLGKDFLEGGAGNDSIVGDLGGDTVLGGNGNDFLDGGDGPDSLVGGAGNDDLFGGIGNDTLEAGDGNDLLDGGEGADKLFGGNGGDLLNGGEGNDAISGGTGLDTLDGSLGSDTLDGDEASDFLMGGQGSDKLSGGEGNDTLVGGSGNDTFTGGGGNDRFVFDAALDIIANVDVITDFDTVADRIHLDDAVFILVPTSAGGVLLKTAFVIGAGAQDGGDRIIYNRASGALLYDSDGTGLSAALQFAQLSPGLALTHQDFLVV
jgi:Ca2+-binding RTX toxin-like protein